MIYALIICIILIGFLGFKLYQKQQIDRSELEKYNKQIENAKAIIEFKTNEVNNCLAQLQKLEIECNDARNERICEETRTQSLKEAADEALNRYHDTMDIKMKELDASIEDQRQKRQQDLDIQFEERQANLDLRMKQFTTQAQERVDRADREASEKIEELENRKLEAIQSTNEQIIRFESILEVLRKYDLDQQEKLFYTIQLPDEFKDDIEFLLTTVAAKVQHPDIISKLVWQEYVKPNLDDTFKRIEIRPDPGIYKLTSLQNGKCYIGKSTNVKNRIADHFKSAIGIKSIADQAVHHAILKEGFWNWQIEIITYCDKEQLGELEKYYIEFFKAQEFGYNKTGGG